MKNMRIFQLQLKLASQKFKSKHHFVIKYLPLLAFEIL